MTDPAEPKTLFLNPGWMSERVIRARSGKAEEGIALGLCDD
ncbi:hypothetical protein [Phytoactinopolyspora mesophila]|nr:hypothetical protein [Phytoactinopolyspora mesophila]